MQISGTVAKAPRVLDKVIFSAIKHEQCDKPIQLVLFRKNRPASLTNALSNAKVGDPITIIGKQEKNPTTNETQIIVTDIIGVEVEVGQSTKDIPCPSVF